MTISGKLQRLAVCFWNVQGPSGCQSWWWYVGQLVAIVTSTQNFRLHSVHFRITLKQPRCSAKDNFEKLMAYTLSTPWHRSWLIFSTWLVYRQSTRKLYIVFLFVFLTKSLKQIVPVAISINTKRPTRLRRDLSSLAFDLLILSSRLVLSECEDSADHHHNIIRSYCVLSSTLHHSNPRPSHLGSVNLPGRRMHMSLEILWIFQCHFRQTLSTNHRRLLGRGGSSQYLTGRGRFWLSSLITGSLQ